MLWQDDDPTPRINRRDESIDLLFRIDCRTLPVDHIHALSQALVNALPLLGEDPRCAIHEIHLAGTQNGWERPDPELGQQLILSRRTRLTLRVPTEFSATVQAELNGKTLDIAGYSMLIVDAKVRKLSTLSTLFARHIALETAEQDDEERLLQRLLSELGDRDIQVKKALCGTLQSIDTPEGPLHTRSIMLADLTEEASVQLQCEGFGSHRHMGCGIFLPHKGIEAVNKQQKD